MGLARSDEEFVLTSPVQLLLGTLFLGTQAGASLPPNNVFYANTKGPAHPYTISRFVAGVPSPREPVISPGGSDFDSAHVAWPSAVQVGGETWVFATGNDGRRWGAVGLWKTRDGVQHQPLGAVFRASTEEQELHMPHVAYDPRDDAAPFKMWYGAVPAKGSSATQIRYAISKDGRKWQRKGPVLKAEPSLEAAGLAPDYACQDANGSWHLFYTGLLSLVRANAMEAVAPAAHGPFKKLGTIFPSDDRTFELAKAPALGATRLELTSADGVRVNGVYLLTDGRQAGSQVVTALMVAGNRVHLYGPVLVKLRGPGSLVSVANRKVSPSSIWKSKDTWYGYFTGFHSIPDVMAEYVFRAVKKTGGWVFDDRTPEMPFYPRLIHQLQSTENAEPVRRGPHCEQP